jgi:thiol:disulfide interchange protein
MLFILVVFAGVLAVVAASKYFVGPERVTWRNDLPAAMADARQANKPVLLYFTAEWCGPCQYMRRNVFTDAGVGRAIEQRYIPVRIDHDQRQDLIVQYQVDAIPWFAVLDADGRPVRKLERGMETPAELIAWLER